MSALLSDTPASGRSAVFLRADVVLQACDALVSAVRRRLDLATAHLERTGTDGPNEWERDDNIRTGGRFGRNQQRLIDLRTAQRLLGAGRQVCGACRLWTQPSCPRDRCGALARPCRMFAPWPNSAAIDAAAEAERRDFSNYLDASYPSLTESRRISFWRDFDDRVALKSAVAAAGDDLDDTRVVVARIKTILHRGARGWHPLDGTTARDLIAAAEALGQFGLDARAAEVAPLVQLIEDMKLAEIAITRADAVAAGFAIGVVWEPPTGSGGGGGGGGAPGSPE